MELEVEKACIEQKADLKSELNLVDEENGTCANCGGKDILRDSCASEDVLVRLYAVANCPFCNLSPSGM